MKLFYIIFYCWRDKHKFDRENLGERPACLHCGRKFRFFTAKDYFGMLEKHKEKNPELYEEK